MNLFVTSGSPVISAKNIDDANLSRHLYWTGQLLCTAIFWKDKSFHKKHKLLKPGNIQHPLCRWTRHSTTNFLWVAIHGLTLMKLYDDVFNKPSYFEEYIYLPASRSNIFPDLGLSKFVDRSSVDSPIDASLFGKYQFTLSREWDAAKVIPQWTNREIPNFWKNWE